MGVNKEMNLHSKYRKNSLLHVGFFAVIVFLFGACQSPVEVSLSPFDEARSYFEFVMTNEDFFLSEEDILQDPEQNEFAKPTDLGSNFMPLYIRRVVMSIDRSFSYDVENNDVAIVTMVRTIGGELRMRGTVRGAEGESTVIKTFSETAVRRAQFERIDDTGVVEHDWQLVAISLLDGGTADREFNIVNLKMDIRGGGTFNFSDPLETYLRIGNTNRGVPAVNLTDFRQSGFRLEITIESSNENPEILFLRHGGVFAGGRTDAVGGYMRRARIPSELSQETSNGIFVRTYTIDWTPFVQFTGVAERGSDIRKGRFSTIVEAISHGTVHTTDEPVETHYWGVPFVIE
jgi:hypothetical protein